MIRYFDTYWWKGLVKIAYYRQSLERPPLFFAKRENIIDNLNKHGLSLNILRNNEMKKIQEFKLFYDKYNLELNIKVLNRFSNFNEITEFSFGGY